MRDYYKDGKDYKGIPFDIRYPKRDYYIPEKEKKEEKPKRLIKNERNTGKDYNKMASMFGDKFYTEYQAYPLFRRRAVILSALTKNMLIKLLDYEKNEKLKALIKDKLSRL